jgi:hypothetical protein
MKIRFDCLFFLGLSLAFGQSASDGKAPRITTAQIQAALQKGREYKSADKYFQKGLRGKRVEPTVYTTVTFFNDWHAIALASANAGFEMRELKADDVHPAGLLHAYVQTKLTFGFGAVQQGDISGNDDFLRHSNLVIMIEGKAVQPVERRTVASHGGTVVLDFDFDVSPHDLLNPVMVVSVDGSDGHRHQKKVNLAGVLDIE